MDSSNLLKDEIGDTEDAIKIDGMYYTFIMMLCGFILHSKYSTSESSLKTTFCSTCNKHDKPRTFQPKMRCKDCNDFLKYHCQHCGKIYTHLRSLYQHLADMKTSYQCDYCEYSTSRKSDLKKHLDHQHLQLSDTGHTCSKCGNCYRYSIQLRRHEKRRHEDVIDLCDDESVHKEYPRLYTCDRCRKSYKYEKALRTHIINCTGR